MGREGRGGGEIPTSPVAQKAPLVSAKPGSFLQKFTLIDSRNMLES